MSEEVEQIEKALKDKDESAMTNITLKYTNKERLKLREDYNKKFARDLLTDIEKNMKSDFQSTLLALYKDPTEYDAELLYNAMKGIGSDKDVISEIICFRDFDTLNKIREKFKEKYGKDLVSELKGETSGDYQKIVMALLEKERSKNNSPDLETCKKVAEELYMAGEKKIGTDENVFIKYFTTLSAEELALVGKEYHKNYKKNIVHVIDNEFNGNDKKILTNILYGLISPSEYFARKINDAVEGIGTADKQLIRCIVTRCEIDMKLIRRYFKQIFKKDMIQRVKDDISGEYQKLLEGLMTKYIVQTKKETK